MANQHTFAVNLLDESFNPEETRNYGLAVTLSDVSISCCILDFRRNKFLGLTRCVRADLKPQDGVSIARPTIMEFLSSVSAAIPWMKSSFKLTKIAFDGRKSTLVPAFLFDPNETEHYMNFNFRQEQDEKIFCDHLMPMDAWQVFAIPEPVVEAAREVFPRIGMVHFSSLLIESVWINYKNRINSPHVFLNLRDGLFDLMIFDGRQMSYFNTFPFQNPEDVAYYLIFVLEQMNFNPENIPLVLLGNVETVDGLPELLHRYIRHIEPGRRNEAYKYSYILNQLPPQTFFPLLNFFSCAL